MTKLVVVKFGGSAIGPDGASIPEIVKRVNDLKKDKVTMKKLNDIWQKEIKVNVNQTWLDGYWKQHVKMLEEFGNSTWSEFDHSGTTSFMDFISKTINKNYRYFIYISLVYN